MPSKTAALQHRLNALSDEIKIALAEGDRNDLEGVVVHFSHTRISQLATQIIEWREDSKTLSKSIHRQLGLSRTLRSADTLKILNEEAEFAEGHWDASLSQKNEKVDDLALLRTLRSDLLLLYEYRLMMHQSRIQQKEDSLEGQSSENDAERWVLAIEQIEKEAQMISSLLQRIKKEEREKQQRVTFQQRIARDLLQLRSELIFHIAQDNLNVCNWLNSEFGFAHDLTDGEKHKRGVEGTIQSHMWSPLMALRYLDKPQDDLLASCDVQAFVILMERLQSFQQNIQNRSNSNDWRQSTVPMEQQEVQIAREESPFDAKRSKSAISPPSVPNVATLLYLEDQIAHHQARSLQEQELRNREQSIYHTNIDRLENMTVASLKAVEALELNVELVTNLYKALNEANTAQEQHLKRLEKERDFLGDLLTVEIRKFSAMKKDDERKDKLIQIAMGARHSMQQFAKGQQEVALTTTESLQKMEKQVESKTKLLAVAHSRFVELSKELEKSLLMLGNAQAQVCELKKRLELFLISQEISLAQSEDHDVSKP
uniref:AlNc14C139G7193 protein n=1 Tax=Albugo laibachii Nc14 TaxID=890382 RepID=F0WL03_9STRA|nr:AlNc14C139G7193 [Albugo laibachii Nc14]|eukprot:CCA21962.1 AlNc14C139G7193 [Albugo laibachii Nc14]